MYKHPPIKDLPHPHSNQNRFSGEATLPIAEICAPTKETTRKTLIELRNALGLSRGHMAALLGVRKDHLRRWEKGARKPSRPAQKLIWIMYSLSQGDFELEDAMNLITWGRI